MNYWFLEMLILFYFIILLFSDNIGSGIIEIIEAIVEQKFTTENEPVHCCLNLLFVLAVL